MDKAVSDRALELRRRILDMGFPCAVSFPPFSAANLRPLSCIVTFQDAVGIIRTASFDDIPALTLGSGFLSSAWNAVQFDTEEELLAEMKTRIFAYIGSCETEYYCIYGFPLAKGFIYIDNRLQFRMYPLALTPMEKRILMLFLFVPDDIHTVQNIEAYCYPYPYTPDKYGIINTIQAHISGINRKTAETFGRKVLRYDRKREGYLLFLRPAEPKKIQ